MPYGFPEEHRVGTKQLAPKLPGFFLVGWCFGNSVATAGRSILFIMFIVVGFVWGIVYATPCSSICVEGQVFIMVMFFLPDHFVDASLSLRMLRRLLTLDTAPQLKN